MKTRNPVIKSILLYMAVLLLVTAALPAAGASVEESGGKETVRDVFFAYPGHHEFDGNVRSRLRR